MSYEDIYALKPIREVEPGWWKLQWRPIWRETVSIYRSHSSNRWGFGIFTYRSDARNGWNRSYKHFTIRFEFWRWAADAWIKWDYIVHQDGPSDAGERRPLSIPTTPAPAAGAWIPDDGPGSFNGARFVDTPPAEVVDQYQLSRDQSMGPVCKNCNFTLGAHRAIDHKCPKEFDAVNLIVKGWGFTYFERVSAPSA